MSEKSFYLSYYQAIIDQNVTKISRLFLYNDEEKNSYPNEYPDLDYNQIFKDSDPEDYVESLLKSVKYESLNKRFNVELKILASNYYLTFYKYITERKINKIMHLINLTSEEIVNIADEFPELNYDNIFKKENPLEYLILLLDNMDLKMGLSNYLLSLYQAILDRDLTLALELHNLSIDQRLNYPKTYSELDVNDVFGDDVSIEVIDALLRRPEYIDFAMLFNDARNPLATEENIAIRENFYYQIQNYPLLNYCSSTNYLSLDNLLSVSYSNIISKESVVNSLMNILSGSSIIRDLLSVVAVSTTIENKQEFSISLIEKKMEKYDPTNNCAGYYNILSNRLVIKNKNSVFNIEFAIHELAHKTMREIFNHGANPYNTELSKSLYHQAVTNTLLNVQEFIKIRFGLEVIFKDKNDTWEMGKTLGSILFPQYLEDSEVHRFVSLFHEYNLNINDHFSWLDGNTPLGNALLYLRFELADALVKAGAIINPAILNWAAMINNSEILSWFLENKEELDINHQDCEGMTALDHASEEQIIKTLISAGAVPYPINFELICRADLECHDTEEDLTIIEKQLYALEILLMFYNKDYDKNDEDKEFIARFPQIIATNSYEGEIVDILKPIEGYWREVISPGAQEYIYQYEVIDFYSNPKAYGSFLSGFNQICEAEYY